MRTKKHTNAVQAPAVRDPFELMERMFADVDRRWADTAWPFRRPAFRAKEATDAAWYPEIDVFEKENRLVTKVDLPGLKKEDVGVAITDGHLAIFGERKTDTEENKEGFYRCERQYGTFYRAVPLPEGVTFDEVKATFADGVLEVSVPLPVKEEAKAPKVEVQEAPKAAKAAE
jgi:HSP20 family protein